MKWNILLWSIVLSAMVIGCSDNVSSSDKENKNFENANLLGNKVITKLAHDKDFRTIQGEFEVWQTKDNEIVLLGKDDTERNLVILQGADKKTNLKDGNYEIIYLKHSVLLNNLDNGTLSYLRVPKPQEAAITEKVAQQDLDIQTRIDGFGLILAYLDYKNNPELAVNKLKQQESLTQYLSSVMGDGGNCGSGGPGATSCSVAPEGGGGCSVSCGAGYYACCNFNCYCVPEQG